MIDNPEVDHKSMPIARDLLVVAALLSVLFAQLYLASCLFHKPLTYCLTKPFWLDEFHTLLLVKEDRVDHLLLKLSQGADTNPPALHVALWLVSSVVGSANELLLRSFSCVMGIGGLIATYFLLRLRFAWTVAWVSVLGMWSSNSLLGGQMFEGRFYSFWFACTAVLCLLLNVRARGMWHAVLVGVVAATMCAVHYFGIIALGLIVGCQFVCNFSDARQRRLLGVALAAGIVALAACLPLYFGQRAAYPVPTWISAPTLRSSSLFIGSFALSYAFTLPLFAYAFQDVLGWRSKRTRDPRAEEFKIYAGSCGLLLLPAVLVVFSYVIQPAQMERYAIPAILASAPLIALVAQRLNSAVLIGLALLFGAVGVQAAGQAYGERADFRQVAALAGLVNVHRPVIVHSRHVAYPFFRYAGINPQFVRICYDGRGAKLSQFDEFEQAVARRMADLFDVPRTIEHDELASLNEFFLLVPPGEEHRYVHWTSEPGQTLQEHNLQEFKMTRSK